jgi:hypothetical protein
LGAVEEPRPQSKRTRRAGRPADLFEAYLASRPESDPRLLLPRSALPLARGAFLLHGVLVQQWSVAWLAAFLFAEFFLVVRLATLGDRLSTGPQLDPALHRRTSLGAQLVWCGLSLAAAAFAGQGLDRSTRGAWFGLGGQGELFAWPSWGVVAYLLLLVGELALDLLAARRERRTFVSASVLQATFFLTGALLLAFVGVFLAGFAGDWFGDAGARAVVALLLVLARTGSDLAVLWFPVWGPARLAKQPAVPRSGKR